MDGLLEAIGMPFEVIGADTDDYRRASSAVLAEDFGRGC